MSSELMILGLTAGFVAFVHTVLGPDHYLPFIVMSKARGWSLRRTMGITVGCGIGHVLGSVLLGGLGIALGWTVGGLERFEGSRGELAGWLLIAFGIVYLTWGIRFAVRRRPHAHWHAHADGTTHRHEHMHRGEHAHVHDGAESVGARRSAKGARSFSLTPWALFLIFVLGPCEPLIPVLMYPAARHSLTGVVVATVVFGITTITTMMLTTALGYRSLTEFRLARLEPYVHAIAGLAVVACGLAVHLGL